MAQCIASVYDRSMKFPRPHQCKAHGGFGNNAEYCRRHAKQFPVTSASGKTMYAVKISDYGSVGLVEVQVLIETEKMVTVKTIKTFAGYSWFSHTFKKDSVTLVESFDEAVQWLSINGYKYVDSLKRNAEKVEYVIRSEVDKLKKSK